MTSHGLMTSHLLLTLWLFLCSHHAGALPSRRPGPASAPRDSLSTDGLSKSNTSPRGQRPLAGEPTARTSLPPTATATRPLVANNDVTREQTTAPPPDVRSQYTATDDDVTEGGSLAYVTVTVSDVQPTFPKRPAVTRTPPNNTSQGGDRDVTEADLIRSHEQRAGGNTSQSAVVVTNNSSGHHGDVAGNTTRAVSAGSGSGSPSTNQTWRPGHVTFTRPRATAGNVTDLRIGGTNVSASSHDDHTNNSGGGRARGNGSRPVAPPVSDLLHTNSTAAAVNHVTDVAPKTTTRRARPRDSRYDLIRVLPWDPRVDGERALNRRRMHTSPFFRNYPPHAIHGLIWEDTRYVWSVLIPVFCGVFGALGLVCLAYALRSCSLPQAVVRHTRARRVVPSHQKTDRLMLVIDSSDEERENNL